MGSKNNATTSQTLKANAASRWAKIDLSRTNSQANVEIKKYNYVTAKNWWHRSIYYTIGQTAW